MALQRLADALHQVFLLHLVSREVDGHAHAQPGVAPGAGLPAGLFDHPVAQGSDQAVAFGQRHELVRVDHAAHRVLPAQQGLSLIHI